MIENTKMRAKAEMLITQQKKMKSDAKRAKRKLEPEPDFPGDERGDV